jgi:hypothetical protein
MKENREAYEQLADRAAQLLAAVANTISKASPEKLKGMEGNVERLLRCVLDGIEPFIRLTRPSSTLQEIKSTTETRLLTPTPSGKLDSVKRLIRTKGKNALRVSVDRAEIKRLEVNLDHAVEEFGVRIIKWRDCHCVLRSFIRSPPLSAWSSW